MRDVNTLRSETPARAVRAFPSEGIAVHEGETKEYLIVPQTMFNVLARHVEGIVSCKRRPACPRRAAWTPPPGTSCPISTRFLWSGTTAAGRSSSAAGAEDGPSPGGRSLS